jgi:hypothetical protein
VIRRRSLRELWREKPAEHEKAGGSTGIGAEHANPHAIVRAASQSEKPPATAPMQNDHGTRICRVVRIAQAMQLLGVTHPRPALLSAVALAKADRVFDPRINKDDACLLQISLHPLFVIPDAPSAIRN